MTDEYNDAETLKADPAPAAAPMTLYRVDGRGRVNLSGLVGDGVEFYTATKNDGLIVLAPVRVATTSVKRTSADEE